MQEIRVDQCMLGAASVKPTQFLAIQCPSFPALVNCVPFRARCSGAHRRKILEGRTQDGRWTTTGAKEYPPGLCRLLAASFFFFAEVDRLEVMCEQGRSSIQEGFARFYVPLDPYMERTVGADFAGFNRLGPMR